MILLEELKKFGLSQSESRAYMALLGLREARATEIARLSRLPRNKIYAIMEGLHRKGFVDIIPEKVTRFRAVPFDAALMLFLEENEKRAGDMMKLGEKIANQLKHVSLEKRSETGEFTVYKSRKVIYKKLEDMLQAAKENACLWLEGADLKRLFLSKSTKEIELSIITKIDAGTKVTAKKWSAFANVKHVDSIPPAKIAVIDNREALVFQTASPIALHSTDRSFVALIRNFVDMLQASSINAKDRITWLETGRPIEEMRIIHGRKDFYNMFYELYRGTRHDVIVLTTANGIIRVSRYLKETLQETRSRGVRIRCMSTINRSNLEAAKDLAQELGVEIRHIEKPRAVLSCHDNSYLLLIQIEDDSTTLDSPEDMAVLTTQRPAVTTFRSILETMWEHAKSLDDRVHEIETGKPAEEVRFIRDEKPIYEITKELSDTAKEEICNISTEGSPERAIKFGTLDTDMDRARSGVKLRYIYPITKNNMELVRKIMEFAEVRHIDSSPIRRVRIIDDRFCLLRQAEEELLNEKFCIFSQAGSFVSAMKMFFEKVWSNAVPAEERIRQLESEDELAEAKKIILQYKEMFPQEPYL